MRSIGLARQEMRGQRVGYRTVRTEASTWHGELTLDLRNGRDWSVGEANLSIGRDTVIVRYDGRDLAYLDRQRFRAWLFLGEPAPMRVDDIEWSMHLSGTYMSVGSACFRVAPDCLSNLIAVI